MRKLSISKVLRCHTTLWLLLAMVCLLTSCAATKKAFNPDKLYSEQQLQEDYSIFRKILEESHPSLYWYTSRDSMNYYFDWGYRQLNGPMTESQFRTLLSYVISKIGCGHTSVKFSKQYAHYLDTARLPQFPLGIKFWDDTAAVYVNVNRKDSLLTRGRLIKGINNVPINTIRDSLFRFMVTDGYGLNHKYQTLSNLGNFGGLYQAVFNSGKKFVIDYADSSFTDKTTTVELYDPKKDTAFRRFISTMRRVSRKERKRNGMFNTRNIQVDTSGSTAFMTVTTFTGGNKLGGFFRNSFRVLKEKNIKNLVIDVRTNGGGNVGFSTKLTEYLIDHKFKLADSLYAVKRLSHYERYIENTLPAFFFMNFMTKKKRDGYYHFGYFERHYFKPKKSSHFNGNIYILTGGNSFSATTLFVNALKGQSNVKVIGEETGGGSYGNTAWFIPDVTLPNTKVRFRLPKFHMVMNKDYPKTGRGIIPDIEVKPSLEAIRKGYDVKLEYVRKLIYGSK